MNVVDGAIDIGTSWLLILCVAGGLTGGVRCGCASLWPCIMARICCSLRLCSPLR